MGRFSLLSKLVLGARKSTLAKLQAYAVGTRLSDLNPGLEVEYRFQESAGDKDLTSPLWKMEGRGVFTRDLQEELVAGRIQCIVHSWKDLDLQERPETEVVSVLPREDQRDILLFKRTVWEGSVPSELVVCTSSPRREFNLGTFLPEYLPARYRNTPLRFEPIRGNIQTRIRKFLEGDYSGLIVAKAALDRLLTAPQEFAGKIPQDDQKEFEDTAGLIRSYLDRCLVMVLPLSINPNAPAQGALALEYLRSMPELEPVFSRLTDPSTRDCTIAERKILGQFGGGCHQKIGVAIIDRSFGRVEFLRGLTDSGLKLDAKTLTVHTDNRADGNNVPHATETASDFASFLPEEVWPIPSQNNEKARTRIHTALPDKDLFVARGFALDAKSVGIPNTGNDSAEVREEVVEEVREELRLDIQKEIRKEFFHPAKRVLWTAGLKTWKELADQDLWVHGTTDSLGETEPVLLDIVLGRKVDLVKLTHEASVALESENPDGYPALATYRVDHALPPQDFDPSRIRAAFWMSGSEFDWAVGKYPQLRDVVHFSGVGSTLHHIRKQGYTVHPVLSYKDWIQTYIQKDKPYS